MMHRFLKKRLEVFCLALLACTQVEETPSQEAQPTDLAQREMWSWSTRVTDKGKARAQVLAGHFEQSTGTERAQFSDGVRVVFYNTLGDTVSTLTAIRGEIEPSGEDMKVFGSVVVVARDSTQLQTDSLMWNRESDRIMGQGFVKIIRPEGTETGVGFDASSDLKQWTLNFVNTRMKRTDP